jgi:hypothetical protein
MAAEACVTDQIAKALNCLTSSVVFALTPPREYYMLEYYMLEYYMLILHRYYMLILHRSMSGKQTH